ncbi:flagellar motor protein MotB [Cellulomonas massiliensis]|uniref:flagellar motor protein MotB n=1 Tax=Cellulomonas massiliensis TaxID=1465811 RepID=UPI0002FAB4AE|nr:flagellar motor protein MotB [Cellulomonas massiliensis]
MSAHGARSRRRGGGHEEEHVNHERWLVSYSDMITVLMALFIVLFAISQVDQDKYIQLRESLAAGFKDMTGNESVLDGGAGTLDGQSAVPEDAPVDGTAGLVDADAELGHQAASPSPAATSDIDPDTLEAAKAEAAHLKEIKAGLLKRLREERLDSSVRFRIDERGLVMALVADDVFFAPASAQLTPTAGKVLDAAGPTLRRLKEQISIEGHANVLPVSGRYATNWELSADRATQVLRHLVEKDRIAGSRIMAIGFGDERPLVAGRSKQAMETNRRVDLVILSGAPEAVRDLLPALTKE